MIILVVDDHEGTARATARVLRMRFDTVHVAYSAAEAEEILAREPVTAVLCDHNLGKGLPTGVELIPKWREQYPEIARAVLYSGSLREEIDLPPEVDLYLAKVATMEQILGALGVEREG